MKREIGSLEADVFLPENPKFKSPLIFVHGLWSGGWSWHEWVTQWSNLGWECWVVNFRGRTEEKAQEILARLTFEDCVNDLQGVVRAAAYPPVILAHNFGGLVAMKVAEATELSALVLMAALPPAQMEAAPTRPFRLLRLKYSPLVFLGRSFRPQEKDFSNNWLSSVPENWRPGILRGVVPESRHLIKEFFYRRVEIDPARIRCPVLVTGGGQDRLLSSSALHELAAGLDAQVLEYPRHGHWMMGETEGQKIVREIHRWVIQKLGERILLAQFPQ